MKALMLTAVAVAFAAGWVTAIAPTGVLQALIILAIIGVTVAIGNLAAIFIWRITYGSYPPFSRLGNRLQLHADLRKIRTRS